MQKDKRETGESFLTPEKFSELQSLGFKMPFKSEYAWIYSIHDSSKKTLIELEKTLSDVNPHQGSCPALSFQDLIRLLPKSIDVKVPDELSSYYLDTDKIDPGVWRHDLEIQFLKTKEIRLGYRWSYFDCSSPLYPFVIDDEDSGTVLDEYFDSGVKSYDWVEAVFELLKVLLTNQLYYANISGGNSN